MWPRVGHPWFSRRRCRRKTTLETRGRHDIVLNLVVLCLLKHLARFVLYGSTAFLRHDHGVNCEGDHASAVSEKKCLRNLLLYFITSTYTKGFRLRCPGI
jgi:hypothetical protein